MDNMLEGISGVMRVMDDILVAAPTIQEHKDILHEDILHISTYYNLRLNFSKCHIQQSSVQYV